MRVDPCFKFLANNLCILNADLADIFLPSVDHIINCFFEGMFTFLILLVMHIIFQTQE